VNRLATTLLLSLVLAALPCVAAEFVAESARDIPVAYDVDVVVVGGSTGAVAAAVEAASQGARVFLAAPRPYLGDDMTATLRLWLEDGETPISPLAKAIFAETRQRTTIPDAAGALPFSYKASLPSSRPHPENKHKPRLTDNNWSSATSQSVQYNGAVTITVDLKQQKHIGRAYLMAYHAKDFLVGTLAVQASRDGTTWDKADAIACKAPTQPTVDEDALMFRTLIKGTARYLKFTVTPREGSGRILLGEIVVTKDGPLKPQPKPTTLPPAKPLHVKRTLDDALLAACVKFLYFCTPTDVLRDAAGRPAGIVMANRAGRQAVVAKVIVDATERAIIARMAGAKARPFPSGTHTVRRVVIGGKPRSGPNLTVRKIEPPFARGSKSFDIFEYTLKVPIADASYAAWAKADQLARDATYHPDQEFTSNFMFMVPPDPIHGTGTDGLKPFRPKGVPRLFVLGACADIPRDQAEKLLRPCALIDAGTRIGAAAAAEAKTAPKPKGVMLAGTKAPAATPGDVGEFLGGVRPGQALATVPQQARTLPVLGRYDVVVVGGGTGGAPAGIGAARRGAKTLVVELLHGLGGVGTLGAISSYYWGNRVGFTKEVAAATRWRIEQRMELWRTKLREAGVDIWFGTLGCGAFVHEGKVRGAVVATPFGRGVVLADVVIDSTGNADVAAAAGAQCVYTDASDIAVQGTGLPPRHLGASYTNTDYTIVDETDMVDVWHTFVYAKRQAGRAFDLGTLIDTRERRRIVGDVTISILDQINRRTYPDTICEAYSNFDTHGYTTHPVFVLQPPDKRGMRSHIPYRALLPKGYDGILVTGLGVSAHRDAIPIIRMQPDIQNQGYAAGVAAAMAAQANCPTRDIDIKALQLHLVETKNIPAACLQQGDSYPFGAKRLAKAVAAAKDNYTDVAILLAQPDESLPLLRKAYLAAKSPDAKLVYAHILAILGDATGLPTLIAAVEAMPGLDEGWRFKAGGQFGRNMSQLDSLVYAMGRTRDRRAVAPILAKLKLITAKSQFSHFRAFALAIEKLGDPAAAAPLARLLADANIRGHAITNMKKVDERVKKWASWGALAPRSNAFRELMLARALYRCGDKDGLGKTVLDEYAKDYRGHLARHAQAVLRQLVK